MRKTIPLLAGGILATTLLAANVAQADEMKTYKVTITNLTPGQPFAPVMAATHRAGTMIFETGAVPSDELAMLAEAGNGQPMANQLLATHTARDAQVSTGGLTFPGNSTTLMITAKKGRDTISVAAMLGATNDAFFAIRDMPLPHGKGQSVVYQANAYDAGSETNDESALTVAGLGGEGYSPSDDGEGFIHIHNGVHGIGDLLPATMDWRNPVAEIKIERVRSH